MWDYTDCDSQDERWMHHYILGKIAEKNDDNSTLFMSHYLKAAEFLDSYGAKFPEHITYTAPQYYSIEVLEVSELHFCSFSFDWIYQWLEGISDPFFLN